MCGLAEQGGFARSEAVIDGIEAAGPVRVELVAVFLAAVFQGLPDVLVAAYGARDVGREGWTTTTLTPQLPTIR